MTIILEMKNYKMILIAKHQKYQHYHQVKSLTAEEILPSGQSRLIKQAKFTQFLLSLFGKTFEKQIRKIEDQGIKQVEALKALKTNEIKKRN